MARAQRRYRSLRTSCVCSLWLKEEIGHALDCPKSKLFTNTDLSALTTTELRSVLALVSDSRLSFLRARIVLNIGVKLETLSNSGEIGRHIFFGH
jgi:hypothetical protein